MKIDPLTFLILFYYTIQLVATKRCYGTENREFGQGPYNL